MTKCITDHPQLPEITYKKNNNFQTEIGKVFLINSNKQKIWDKKFLDRAFNVLLMKITLDNYWMAIKKSFLSPFTLFLILLLGYVLNRILFGYNILNLFNSMTLEGLYVRKFWFLHKRPLDCTVMNLICNHHNDFCKEIILVFS